MTFYNNKKYEISSTYENNYLLNRYKHKTEFGIRSYIDDELVLTPYNKEDVR